MPGSCCGHGRLRVAVERAVRDFLIGRKAGDTDDFVETGAVAGVESIRPHLRAQLDEQKLWRPTFPPDPDDEVERGGGKGRGR